jgi:hypothetical protein
MGIFQFFLKDKKKAGIGKQMTPRPVLGRSISFIGTENNYRVFSRDFAVRIWRTFA